MSFNRPTLGSLINTAEAEINALVPNADARMRFSILGVFARVWAALTDGLYSALVFLSRQMFVMTATRTFLTLIAESYGIFRLLTTPAQGCITLTGAAGTAVPAGTIFQRADGLQYQATAGTVIPPAGFIDLAAIALTQGELGNAASGVLLQPTSPIAGLAGSVVCAAGMGAGADDETDDALRARVLLRLRNPPGAGTAADWTRWALSMNASVTRVWVVPAVYGHGTVGIVFAQDDVGIVPNPAAIAAMESYLADFTPAGSVLHVFAPTLVPVDFNIHELPNNDPAIRESIRAELADLLFREAGPGSTVPLTHIHEAISSAQGEFDHVLVAPVAPLVFTAVPAVFQVGVLGVVNWV
ncbi:MAG: baseplate J/gp47 family protein [Pseudomonadota bacterium]